MDDAVTSPITTLRRRTKHHHPSSSSSSAATATSSAADFELVSLKPASYTSLRDILPTTAAQSPRVPSFVAHSGYEIPIRNRLVKQAAWAYLQPMSTSPGSAGSTVFHRLWARFSDACLRLFDCLLQVRTTTSRL